MTLSELSLRGARRQIRDYLVYFVTVSLAAALIYAFNGLVSSQEIRNLSELMNSLPLTITLASIVVVCIIGWLVCYTMGFMLTKRSRELGTYILLGIENKQVAQLFFIENLVIGGIALVFGVLFGNLIFQGLRAITLQLFDVPYEFGFSFSLPAIGLTFAYFILIYLFALIKSRKRIYRMKIYDLLYFDRQNETAAMKKGKSPRKMFTTSVLIGIIGTLLLTTRNLALGILGSALIILFLYGFFISFSSGVPAYFDKRPAKKYNKTNLLVFRSLSSKLNTTGVTMATIALLFTATLIAEGTALLFTNQFQRNEKLYTSYDLFIGSKGTVLDLDDYEEYINEHISLRENYKYYIYLNDTDIITQYIGSSDVDYWRNYDKDPLMRASDYFALRKMLGWPEVHLNDGYIIHCMDYLEDVMLKYNEPLNVDGSTLTLSGIYTEDFTQYLWDGNGRGFLLVVPDEVIKTCEPVRFIYAAMTDEPVRGESFEALQAIRDIRSAASVSYDSILSPAAVQDENAALYAMIVFPLFYLALVADLVAATILTIHLLSDVNRYRRYYALLFDLGMDKHDMCQALRRQFFIFYAMPAIPPMFISTTFMAALGSAFDPGIILGSTHLLSLIGTALVMFFAIYFIYIAASYTSFKRNVIPD